MAQVVGQDQVPGEGVREGLVEVQHLQQSIPLNRVQIAVSERPNIRRALADRRVRPEAVAEDVTLAQYRYHLVVLYHLEAAGHDEAQRINGFARVIEQIARRAVRHCEVHRQSAQTPIGR